MSETVIKKEKIIDGGMTTWPIDNPAEYYEKVNEYKPKDQPVAAMWDPDWRTTVINEPTKFRLKWEAVDIFVDSNHLDSPYLGYDSTQEETWVSFSLLTEETNTYISLDPNSTEIPSEDIIEIKDVTPPDRNKIQIYDEKIINKVMPDGYGVKKIFTFKVARREDNEEKPYELHLQARTTDKGKELYGEFESVIIELKQLSLSNGDGDAGIGGELCLYEKANSRFISVSKNGLQAMVKSMTMDTVRENYIPIGIILVPVNHYRYDKDKKICGVISLNEMSTQTPVSGSLVGNEKVVWGPAKDTVLTSFGDVIHYGLLNLEQMKIVGTVKCSRIPSDNYTGGTPSKRYPRLYYSTDSKSVDDWYAGPSPYNEDGTANPDYTIPEFEGVANALSDFDGKENTKKLLDARDNSYQRSDFENGNTRQIKEEDYPAATCCSLYAIEGLEDKNIEWYLPSVGELGYLIANLRKFNETLEYTNRIWVGKAFPFTASEGIWSSTVYSNENRRARTINALHGKVGDYIFYQPNWTRAFTQIEIE